MTAQTERKWMWVHRIVVMVMSVFMPITGYTFVSVSNKFREHELAIQDIKLNQQLASVGVFNAESWKEQKQILDQQAIQAERRIIRLEESIPYIKESLVRIETNLEKKSN